MIMQKNGAGLHTASSCYWNNETDGSCTVSGIFSSGMNSNYLINTENNTFLPHSDRYAGRTKQCTA